MPLIFTVVAVPYVCFYRVYLARDFSEAEPRVLWSRKIIWPPPMLSNQQNWPPLLELTVHGNLRRVFGHFWGWSLALCFCDRSSLSYAGSLPFALILHNSLLRQVRNDLQLFPWNSCLAVLKSSCAASCSARYGMHATIPSFVQQRAMYVLLLLFLFQVEAVSNPTKLLVANNQRWK